MKKDFEDNEDDFEELDDDDLDEDKDEFDSEDYDDDLDELEELVDEDDANGNVKAGVAPFPAKEKPDGLAKSEEDAWEEEEEVKKVPSFVKREKKEDDDSAFFEEALDEGDDLGIIKEPDAQVAEPVTVVPPTPVAPAIAAEAAKPSAKGIQPVLFILPAIAILMGIGFYFFKGGKSENLAPRPAPQLEKTAPPIHTPTFIKPKIDDSIPDHYEEMMRIEISDPLKIASLVERGLLKKNAEDSSREVGQLTLVLYKTDSRYVVSQTYQYTDGGKWTVETQFSDLDSDPGDVAKAFKDVYAG